MSYLKLLSARRKSGRTPTMEPVRLTDKQKALAAAGRCIACGRPAAQSSSYVCKGCQGKETIEDIRDEIAAVRRHLLKQPSFSRALASDGLGGRAKRRRKP